MAHGANESRRGLFNQSPPEGHAAHAPAPIIQSTALKILALTSSICVFCQLT